MNVKIRMSLAFFSACAGLLASAAVKQAQEIALKPGWNAVYVVVSPEETADEIFGKWPVSNVAIYDPAAFLETCQYSGEESSEGVSQTGYRMWRRGQPVLSTVERLVGNSVCVCFSTNDTPFAATLFGRPCAPCTTWHPTSTNDALNLVGVSVAPEAAPLPGNYFEGLTAGQVAYYTIGGSSPEAIRTSSLSIKKALAHGQVVAASATKVSDWSGVLNVSPIAGLDFSTNLVQLTFSVRNDGAKARTVSLSLGAGEAAAFVDIPPVPPGLMLRDASVYTNGWQNFAVGAENAVRRVLEPGVCVTWGLAFDRTKVQGPAGTRYGALLHITDVDGGSGMRVTLPVEATSDGGVAGENAWPKGVWLAQGELDTVTFFDDGTAREVKSGGKTKVRLPLYVDRAGNMKLLQRFTFGNDTNGVLHVFSGERDFPLPVALVSPQRVSSAVLPIDHPVIGVSITTNAPTEVVTNGAFGVFARFDFAVGEDSKVNPYRHAYHPSHDGLRWDFATATPSGDNITNYVSTVKPEVFSVGNRIVLTWDGTNGTAWSPEEELSGTLSWELSGVRHEGAIRMSGRFAMKRIASVTLDK